MQTIVVNVVQHMAGKSACKKQAAGGRIAIVRDLCLNSRFMHAQFWTLDRCLRCSSNPGRRPLPPLPPVIFLVP